MPAVTRAQRQRDAVNLLHLPDEVLSAIIQLTYDPFPVEEAVAHIPWAQRQRFDNQSLLALSLTHSRLRALASFWLSRHVYFACRRDTHLGRNSESLSLRYQIFANSLSARPNLMNEIQCAFLEEPDRPMTSWFSIALGSLLSKSTSLKTLVVDMQDTRHLKYWGMFSERDGSFPCLETLIYSNKNGADIGDVLELCLLQKLRFLAVDMGMGDPENDFNDWEEDSDDDPADYDLEYYFEDEEHLRTIVADKNFARRLCTLKCFISDGPLPISLFGNLLPHAHHLDEIGLTMRSFQRSRTVKHLKALLQILASKGKQLKKLTLSTERTSIRRESSGLHLDYFDRLKILTISSMFIFGKTQIGDTGCPKYDPDIYKRLPPNLEEFYLTFTDYLGLARDLSESLWYIVHGDCKCEDKQFGEKDKNVTQKQYVERVRRANFRRYWHNLVLDVRNGCESTIWLTNLVKQCKDGNFRLKKIIVREESALVREICQRSGIASGSMYPNQPSIFMGSQINRKGIYEWLEPSEVDVQLYASVLTGLEEDASQILEHVTTNQCPNQTPCYESPYGCAKCQQDSILRRYPFETEEGCL